ncbi:MAG TPA: DUF5916 domain-containing protein [Gemmatimonadales bacterium]|nr:DUF5916 domain-containing protein [Gemmatimonadales bacterium]
MRRLSSPTLLAVLALAACTRLAAQVPDTLASIAAGRLTGSIQLDGSPDEAAWAEAAPATPLTQRDPDEGAAPSEQTEIRVLLSGDALYIAARLHDRDPARVRALLTRRDATSESDRFTVELDSRFDRLTAFVFEVNPRGVRRDGILQPDGTVDYSPDPVWEAAVREDTTGWSAEIRIPLSQLRFNRGGDSWGVQFIRFIQRRGEEDVFAFVPKTEHASVSRFGRLTGLADLPALRHAEVAPYVTGRGEYTHPEAGDPFHDGSDYFTNAGADLRLGVGGNLALDATVNPDFGQVEVDPAIVNLSANETFFDEKRPFFLEGASLFSFAQVNAFSVAGFPGVFNSRRVGRPPQRSLEDDDPAFSDAPVVSRIPAALKLTGKSARGWSVALLDAVTREEQGRFVDSLGASHRVPLEPLSNYFVGRLRRESADGNRAIGGLFTSVDRRLDDSALAGLLRSSAYLAGVDVNRYWANQGWAFDAFVTGSLVRGDPAAITRTQRSSARYYQRPDAERLSLDSTRTSLAGYNWVAALTKLSGQWLGSVTLQDKSPGYETNDAGFEVYTNRRAVATDMGYAEYRPGRLFRNYEAHLFSVNEWDYDWNRITFDLGLKQVARFRNFWQATLTTHLYPATSDDHLTRGGPLTRAPAARQVTLQLDSDRRHRHTLGIGVDYFWNTAQTHTLVFTPSITLNPRSNLQVALTPSLVFDHEAAQYVQTETDPTATATFGGRYVFAELRQTQLAFETRVNWTFTPTLSLQLYAQPLLSANGFRDYKELRAPKTYDFAVYGRDRGTIAPDGSGGFTVDPDGAAAAAPFTIDDQSFNFRSLRANLVLRWEYRPGSTLFLVWQQSRSNQVDGVGDFDFGRDFKGLRATPADNLLAVKLSYWLGL